MNPAFRQVDVLDATRKAHFATERFDSSTQRLDHGWQTIAAKVRALFVDDRVLSLALGEEFEDAANVGASAAIGQFAIAKSSGTAFAEQVVTFGVVRSAFVEATHIADAIANGAAALQHERTVTLFGQEVGRCQAAGTGTDHDRAVRQRRRSSRRQREWLFAIGLHAHRSARGAGSERSESDVVRN